MFLLPGEETVSDGPALQAALERGLAQTFRLPPATSRVTLAGSSPLWERLAIDVSGGHLGPEAPPTFPAAVRERSEPFTVAQLSVVARPLRWSGAASVDLDLNAQGARLSVVQDARAARWLALVGVDHASIRVDIAPGQLQALVTDLAQRLARSHGLTVKEAKLDLSQPSPDALALMVRLSAQKSLLRGTVIVSGTVRITQALEAQLSGLSCQGEGVVGGIAAKAIQPLLQRWNGRSFPVTGHAFGHVRVQSFRLELGQGGAVRLFGELVGESVSQ